MSNEYIIYYFRAEIQETRSWSEVTINITVNKKLSYRKEAACCSVLLKIFSLKVAQGHSNLFRSVGRV